jgi:EAL domain-containing protein (putative c-di-GMP-specific phosphodiesterase class I)
VEPGSITVEVTESAAVKDVEQAAAALESGARSASRSRSMITALASRRSAICSGLPASELKIDKSFIQNIVADNRDAIMVRSTVALAHQLGMKVVAEGVEDDATLALLREFGCDVAQGWLIGKPMPREQLEAMLDQSAALAA